MIGLLVNNACVPGRDDFLHADPDPWTRPISARHRMIETLTVFDDVFVPWERVFLHGDTARAGRLALTFVEYHRLTAVSYKLPLVDTFVGLAGALAEANGIARASHVRDKFTWLIGYAETVRGLTHLACDRALIDEATEAQMLKAGNVGGELLNWIAMLGTIGERKPVFVKPQMQNGHAYAVWRWS